MVWSAPDSAIQMTRVQLAKLLEMASLVYKLISFTVETLQMSPMMLGCVSTVPSMNARRISIYTSHGWDF